MASIDARGLRDMSLRDLADNLELEVHELRRDLDRLWDDTLVPFTDPRYRVSTGWFNEYAADEDNWTGEAA